MLTRVLLVLVALGAGSAIANGQPAAAPKSNLPAPCRAQSPADLPVLEKRKERLERRIARTQAGQEPAAGEAKALSEDQAALLEVLFQIHCLKVRQQAAAAEPDLQASREPGQKTRGSKARAAVPPPAEGPAPTGDIVGGPAGRVPQTRELPSSDNAVEVTTYFATNRGRSGKSEPENVYTATDASLSYGRAVVTVPSTHTPGSLELPSIWKLQLQPDPNRHFVLKSVTPLKPDYARTLMAKALQETPSKALLLFVHGYNMSFAETAMRTAQLAYDLDFPGLPFFFSWPSAGQVTGYLRDAESAQLSEQAFDQMLSDLTELPIKDIYIIAHSMGSRIVSQVLRSRVERGKATARVGELLLAAPDINADLFRRVIAPKLAEMRGTQTTVYASSSDLALIASKTVHGYRRVGETAGGVFVYPGLDTVDASSASPVMRAFGHSYLTDSAAVLKDIRSLLRQKLSAKERGLTQTGISPDLYWSLP